MTCENPKDTEFIPKTLTFEQALNRLDETVRVLEAGGLSLDEATRLFEEGTKLARISSEMLAAAELRISRIKTSYDQQIELVDEEEMEEPS